MSLGRISRRTAAAFIMLARLPLIGAAIATVARVEAQSSQDPADPDVLVRITFPNAQVLRASVRKLRIEVIRVTSFEKPFGPVTALVLMRRSALDSIRQDASVKIEIVAEPPITLADTPQVGKGNRFANPHALPKGQGVLHGDR